jgi:predicted DNA-binding transcriptional regulator AlpA
MATRIPMMTITEFCAEIGINRSTFYEWKTKKLIPRCRKLPNGQLRIRVTDYEAWLDTLPEAA